MGLRLVALLLPTITISLQGQIMRSAQADGTVELVAGTSLPAGDHVWRNEVGPSAKFGARLAAWQGELGGMLSLDVVPLNENLENPAFGCGRYIVSSNVYGQQVRVLAHGVFQRRVSATMIVDVRVGAGVDLNHLSYDSYQAAVIPETSTTDVTDTALAFEAGVGAWFDVGSVEVGGLVATPFSYHHGVGIHRDYVGYNVDVLLGIRLGTRRGASH